MNKEDAPPGTMVSSADQKIRSQLIMHSQLLLQNRKFFIERLEKDDIVPKFIRSAIKDAFIHTSATKYAIKMLAKSPSTAIREASRIINWVYKQKLSKIKRRKKHRAGKQY